MNYRTPKNSPKYHWTSHVVEKMRYYGLSANRVIRVVRNPARVEEGIVDSTIAVMQPSGSGKHPFEIWVMYAQNSKATKRLDQPAKKVIISAWRYPGVSPKGNIIPIPDDIKAELEQVLKENKI